MQIVALYIFMALVGFVVLFITSILGQPYNILGSMFGGLMMFMSVMQMLATAKAKGFLPLFKTLKDNECYTWIPNQYNRIRCYITVGPHKGILYKKDIGLMENKGTNFNFGNSGTMNFCYPWSGYTIDLPAEHYFSKTKDEYNIDSFDEHVKKYLGESNYTVFCSKFRTNDKKQEITDIEEELQWIIDQKPENSLEINVFGETVDFKSQCKYLMYNYDPVSALNATERERLIALKEGMDYREKMDAKYMGIAKAAVIILMGLGIFFALVSSLDMSNLFGIFT